MRRRGLRTPLPAIIFRNVCSICNITNKLAANCKYIQEYRDGTVIASIESWLLECDVDGTVEMEGFTLVQGDRMGVDKVQGGGMAV